MGTNVSTTYITAPAKKKLTLGIKLQFLVMIIKNVTLDISTTHPKQLKKFFTFEVQVLDDKQIRRRFRASNYQVEFAISRIFNFPLDNHQSQALHLYHAHEAR